MIPALVFWCLLLALFQIAAYQLPSNELNALLNLYSSCGGSNWEWKTPYTAYGYPWQFSSSFFQNPCNSSHNWQGITCSSDCSITPCNVQSLVLYWTQLEGNLTYLKTLDFSNNFLVGSIPDSIGKITSLRSLFLSNNKLQGTIPNNLSNLTQLQYLYLFSNRLTGTIPPSLGTLRELLQLELHVNQLHGTIPPSIGNLPQLNVLYLSTNHLTGNIPDSFSNLHEMFYMSLAQNALDGAIPASLGNLTNIQYLFLYENLLSSTLPASLGNLTVMAYFDLHANALVGTIPDSFGHLQSLQSFSLYSNHLHGPIPSSLGGIKDLFFVNFNDNQLSGSLPAELGSLVNLQELILDKNALRGSLPSHLGNATKLVQLTLSNNQLTGEIPTTFYDLNDLQILDLSTNFLTGTAPIIVADNLVIYNLRNNNLHGKLPMDFLCNYTQLQQIDCTDNMMSGNLALTMPSSNRNDQCFDALVLLQLSNNHFTGSLPAFLLKSHLAVLYLDQNAFSGTIPQTWFAQAFSLKQLCLAENCLSGTIPDSICTSTQLQQVSLDGLHAANTCVYPVLPWFSQSGLYANRLVEGTIPSCLFSFTNMSQLQLSGNLFTGTIPSNITTKLQTLILANNQLSGTIPLSLWESEELSYLDLSFNRFQDTFPSHPFPVLLRQQQSHQNTSKTNNSVNIAFYLQNNRLSGSLPTVLQKAVNVNVLEGNQFSCKVDRSDLPNNDPQRSSYDCGSDTADASVVIWTFFVIMTIVPGVVGFYLMKRHIRLNNDTDATEHTLWKMCYEIHHWWQSYKQFVVEGNHERNHDCSYEYLKKAHRLLSFAVYFCLILMTLGMFILLPSYAALNYYYRTHDNAYIWVLSSSYLSGRVPAVFLCILYTILLCSIFGTTCSIIHVWTEQQSQSRATSTVEEGGNKDEEDNEQETEIIQLIKKQSWVKYFLVRGEYALFLIVNMIIVCGVNMAYVYIVVVGNYDIVIIVIASLILSIFKLVWNSALLGGELYRFLIKRVLVNVRLNGLHFLYLSLFNNILVPYIAQAFVSPTCFLYAVRLPPSIQIYLAQYLCRVVTSITDLGTFRTIICNNDAYNVASYYPTFNYTYQCSSSLVSAFAHVFVYRYLISGLLMPIMYTIIQMMVFAAPSVSTTNDLSTSVAQANFSIRYYLRSLLPSLWRLNIHKTRFVGELSDDTEWLFFHKSVQHSPFGNLLAIEIMTSIAMMLTFGISFPLLMIIIALSVVSRVVCYYLLMGRWIAHMQCSLSASRDGEEQRYGMVLTHLLIYVNSKKLHEMGQIFSRGFFLAIAIAAMFQSFTLFDILGDDVGSKNAYWIVLTTILIVLVVLNGVTAIKYSQHKGLSRHNAAVEMNNVVLPNLTKLTQNPLMENKT